MITQLNMTKMLKIRCVYKRINFLIILLVSREMEREQARVLGIPLYHFIFRWSSVIMVSCSWWPLTAYWYKDE